jgi:hypothetical protein
LREGHAGFPVILAWPPADAAAQQSVTLTVMPGAGNLGSFLG